MKKRYLLFALLLCVFTTIVHAEQFIFTKNWDSESTSFGKTNYNALYKMDNLAFKDTVLTVSFTHENEIDDNKCESDYCLIIKQYDKNGNQINELYFQNVINYIAPVVIDDYLYIVVNYGTKPDDWCLSHRYYNSADCIVDFHSYIEKYDINLNKQKSLSIDTNYYAWTFNKTNKMNSMFTGAYCYGMPWQYTEAIIDGTNCLMFNSDPDDYTSFASEEYYNETIYEYYDFYQIHEEGNNIVVWTITDDIVIDKNLTNINTRDNSWIAKYGDGSDYSYFFIDSDNYMESGYEMIDDNDANGFIKVTSNNKELFTYTSDKYYAFYFPIKVNDYYLAIGQPKDGETDTEIIVLDINGKVVQTIKGNFWNLRAIKNGFAVTNIKASLGEYMMNASEDQDIYTEVFNCFVVDTKTDGNGEITYARSNIDGKDIVEFTVQPKDGYVLGIIKITDSKGNVIEFTNNTFVMPTSDVIIEATFIPKNPNTAAFISVGIVVICIISLISIKYLHNKKELFV